MSILTWILYLISASCVSVIIKLIADNCKSANRYTHNTARVIRTQNAHGVTYYN